MGRGALAGLVAARRTPTTAACSAGHATSTAVYAAPGALWSQDADPAGFQWIDANDAAGNVFSFLRLRAPTASALGAASRTSPAGRRTRATGSACRAPARWEEVLNTDAEVYGGSGVGNLGGVEATGGGWHGQPGVGDAARSRRWHRLAAPRRLTPASGHARARGLRDARDDVDNESGIATGWLPGELPPVGVATRASSASGAATTDSTWS